MSPEQAAGRLGALGPASDIYSLGATLYVILTGRLAFGDRDVRVVLEKINAGVFPPPRSIRPNVPAALEAVCLKAMATRPADRYPSAMMLAEDLERWLADEPVAAYREPLGVRFRRKLRRHRQAVAIASAALFFTLIGLVVITLMQSSANRTLAEANEKERKAHGRAEERFALARDAIRQYYRGASEDVLLKQKEFEGLRGKLLSSALGFYRTLAEDLETIQDRDETTAVALAQAYLELGDVTEKVGSQPDALESYRRALELYRTLNRKNPADLEFRRGLAHAHHDVGRMQRMLGRPRDALAAYEAARELFKAMADSRPGDAPLLRDLADANNNIGNILGEIGRPEEALAAYKEVLRLRKELADADPTDRTALGEVAEILSNIGLYLFAAGDPGKAIDSLEQARKIQQELADASPPGDETHDKLSQILYNIGLMQQANGQAREALQTLERSARLREALQQAHPTELRVTNNLGLTWMNIGLAHMSLNESDPAEKALGRALDVQRPLADSHPEVLEYRSNLSATLDNLGMLYRNSARMDASLRSYNEALMLRERVAAENPAVEIYRADLADTLSNIGRIQAASGRKQEALNSFRRAVAIRRTIASYEQLMLYGIACELAMCVPLLDRAEASTTAAEAVQALRGAIDRGFRNLDQLATDRTDALASLGDREDFRKLMTELGLPKRGGAEKP